MAAGSALGGSGGSIREVSVSGPLRSPWSPAHGLLAGGAAEGPSSGSHRALVAAVPEAALAASSTSAAGAPGRSSAPASPAAETRAQAAAQRRRRREACFVYYYRVFSHRDAVVRELIRSKMIDAVEPRGWRCPACEVAKAHRNHFGGSGREEPAPWAIRLTRLSARRVRLSSTNFTP